MKMKRKYPGRKPGSTTVTEEERAGIIADCKSGMSLSDMVAKYKRSKSTVWNTARKAGVPFARNVKKRGPKKQAAQRNFVTDDERARMAEDYSAGMKQATMVAKYGRSKAAILRAVKMSGLSLRGRGHAPNVRVKKSTRDKMRKKAKRAAMATSIVHANRALAKAHKSGDVVARAVGVLIKSLEQESIQDIFIDFDRREYKTTRLRVEEGRVA
jgi:hypothetical protein